ncbi:hypothetical protein SAY86_028150 [Trapa natans]|uniref:Uncharacterized protein n=1 Tax=Trapa natans TaxID=22666 RepID=A0AAN7M1S9_TRANT|nr:hypothetical protein SAY86_028150 [Trapa natans]
MSRYLHGAMINCFVGALSLIRCPAIMSFPVLSQFASIKIAATENLSLLALALSAVFALAWYLWIICFRTPKGSPPGPFGLPIVGSLPFLDPELHTYFADLARRYGPVLKIMLGKKVCIVVSSPSAAREVLKDQDTTFANRDVPIAARIATYGGKDIGWNPYGPEWRMLRKICVLKMLSNATLDSVYGLRRREVRTMVKYLYEQAGSPVNVGEQMFLTILNVVTGMIWGGTLQGEARDMVAAEFRSLVSGIVALLGKPNVSDFFPGLARFDLQGVAKEMKVLAKQLDGIFETVIDQRVRMEEEGGGMRSSSNGKDFLAYLLKVKDEEDFNPPLTMAGLKALLMDMVTGGTDTSSNMVEFTMAEVMNKPHVLARVQQELDSVVGKEKVVEESHMGKLPYLQAVIKESLRLHPALPLLIPHCPSKDATIGGFTVPKGTRIFVNVWAIHHDPSLWENPSEFDPGRFLEEGTNKGAMDYGGKDFTYFPFGSGRRICAGIAMAERMLMYSLATLLHSFDWRLPEAEKMDLDERFSIVLKKRIPLKPIPTPRLSSPALYEE